MAKKTLGGARLGTGAGIDVNLGTYERSTHNLSKKFRTSMGVGTLVPFLREWGVNGDTWDIDLNAFVRTLPTVGPLFGSFKLQMDIFQVPVRLYMARLHNNKIGIGLDMKNQRFPTIELTAPRLDENIDIPLEWQQFDQSSLMAYLGYRGIGGPTIALGSGGVAHDVNAIFPLAYYDIYKNYYANKQEGIGVVCGVNLSTIGTANPIQTSGTNKAGNSVWSISGPAVATGFDVDLTGEMAYMNITLAYGTTWRDIRLNDHRLDEYGTVEVSGPDGRNVKVTFQGYYSFKGKLRLYNKVKRFSANSALETFPLENIDNIREYMLENIKTPVIKITKDTTIGGSHPLACMVDSGLGDVEGYTRMLQPNGGLAVKTYQSDLFNNWLKQETIVGEGSIQDISRIDVTGGYLNIDSLVIARKVYNYLNRIAVCGGTYEDWMEATYGDDVARRTETPVYCGGMSSEIEFEEVISTAETQAASGDQPLGSLAGRGTQMGRNGGHVTIKCTEPCVIMGLVSITPRIDYSQGNHWSYNLETMEDLHKPMFDEIGFQDLLTNQMHFAENHWMEGPGWIHYTAGKQPAWINWMTNVDETFGNFAHPDREMYMTLNRRYETVYKNEGSRDGFRIKDLTTYIDPSKYNYIFANTDLDSQNFWVQIGSKMIVRRKMSAKLMPNL